MLKQETSTQTILVVDDDAEIREALATILNEEGYPVRTAMNGRDALSILEQIDRPGMILLDLTMPVMDGNNFIAGLTDRHSLAGIPVVVVSAVAHRAMKGVAGIIDKPIDFNRLLGYARRFCGSPAEVA